MKKLLLLSLAIIAISCTDSEKAKFDAFGSKFKIDLVNCDGTVTHAWISTGKVSNSKSSDGYYFNDEKTGTLIEVSGTVIITKL